MLDCSRAVRCGHEKLARQARSYKLCVLRKLLRHFLGLAVIALAPFGQDAVAVL